MLKTIISTSEAIQARLDKIENQLMVDEDVHVVDRKEDPKEEVKVIEDPPVFEDPKEEVKVVEDPPVSKDAKDEIQESTIKANESLGNKKILLAKENMSHFYSQLELAKTFLANKEEVEKLIKDHEKPQDTLKVLEKNGSLESFRKTLLEANSYQPKLPFPHRVKSQLIARQKQGFIDVMDKVVVTLPLVEAIENSPTWSKFFNEPIKKEPTKGGQLVSIDTSDMLEGEMEEEIPMKDPLEVTLVVEKNEHGFLDKDAREYEDVLNALSSDMDLEVPLETHGNVIHQSHIDKVIWEENEKFLEELAKHLASPIEERVSKEGNVEDFPIIVDGCIDSTDLLVIDMVESKEKPFVLETPLLNTIGAKINFVTKEVVLENVDNEAFCPIKSPFSKSCEPITMEESSNLELKPPWDENLGDVESKHQREPPLATKKKRVEIKIAIKKKKFKKKKRAKSKNELECMVKTKHDTSPFAKARILLGSTSQAKKGYMLGEKMASLFTMRPVDLEPKPPDGPPPFNH